jgi:hypothetical protein
VRTDRRMVVAVLLGLVVSGCGGGAAEPGSSSPSDDAAIAMPAGDGGDGLLGIGDDQGTATLEMDGETFEFDLFACSTDPVSAGLRGDEGGGTFNVLNDIVMFGLTLRGQNWGSSLEPLPEVNGQTVAWTGTLVPDFSGGERTEATLTITCS